MLEATGVIALSSLKFRLLSFGTLNHAPELPGFPNFETSVYLPPESFGDVQVNFIFSFTPRSNITRRTLKHYPGSQTHSGFVLSTEGGGCVLDENVKEPARRDGADVAVLNCVQLDVLVQVRLLSLACTPLMGRGTDDMHAVWPQAHFDHTITLFVSRSLPCLLRGLPD